MKASSAEWKKNVYEDNRKFVYKTDITLADGTVLHVDDSQIMQNGVSFSGATSESGVFSIGSMVSSKVTVRLNNMYDDFSVYDFTNATAYVYVGMLLSETTEWLKLGQFNVESPTTRTSIISLEMLDNLSKTDKVYVPTVSFPCTRLQLVQDACNQSGIFLNTTNFYGWNSSVVVFDISSTMTCRQILSYVAQIGCLFGSCDENGYLNFKWYDTSSLDSFRTNMDGGNFTDYTSGTTVDGGDFTDYSSGDVFDGGSFTDMDDVVFVYSIKSQEINTDDVVITGVKITYQYSDDETKELKVGTDGYVIGISENPLINKGNVQAIANYIYSIIGGLIFRPLTVNALADPRVEPGDIGVVIDRKQNVYPCIFTTLNVTYGNYETYTCDAESAARNSADKYSATTAAIIAARKKSKEYYDAALKYTADAKDDLQESINGVTDSIGDMTVIVGDTVADGIINENEIAEVQAALTGFVRAQREITAEYNPLNDSAYIPDENLNTLTTIYEKLNLAYNSLVASINAVTTSTKENIRSNYSAYLAAVTEYNNWLGTFKTTANEAIMAIGGAMSDDKIATYDLAVQRLTNLMTNCFGVFKTEEVQDDGSVVYYMHNKPSLADSDKKWKMTADGFAVSTDGGANYGAGFDAQGNAVFNVLNAIGINANWINVGDLTVGGKTGNTDGKIRVLDANGTLIASLDKTGLMALAGYIGGTNGWKIESGLLSSTEGVIKLVDAKDPNTYLVIQDSGVVSCGKNVGTDSCRVDLSSGVVIAKDLTTGDYAQLAGSNLLLWQKSTKYRYRFHGGITFEKSVPDAGAVGGDYVYVVTGSSFDVYVPLCFGGSDAYRLSSNGSIYANNVVALGRDYYARNAADNDNTTILGLSASTNAVYVGNANTKLVLRGTSVHLGSSGGQQITTSDERVKNSFKNLDEFDNIYMSLHPISFKYNTDYTEKFHFGFTAQNIKESLEKQGYDAEAFAGFAQWDDNPESQDYCGINDPMGLVYTEFISWNTHMIQKQKKRLDELELKVSKQDEIIKALCEKVGVEYGDY